MDMVRLIFQYLSFVQDSIISEATKLGAAGRNRTADEALRALPSLLATAALPQTECHVRCRFAAGASCVYGTRVRVV